MTFQSRCDVAVFVENKMPSNSFSMFQDIVTLMERLSGTYVERKDVISEWYQATKVGLDEREARHVASFKITSPIVFGYIRKVPPHQSTICQLLNLLKIGTPLTVSLGLRPSYKMAWRISSSNFIKTSPVF